MMGKQSSAFWGDFDADQLASVLIKAQIIESAQKLAALTKDGHP